MPIASGGSAPVCSNISIRTISNDKRKCHHDLLSPNLHVNVREDSQCTSSALYPQAVVFDSAKPMLEWDYQCVHGSEVEELVSMTWVTVDAVIHIVRILYIAIIDRSAVDVRVNDDLIYDRRVFKEHPVFKRQLHPPVPIAALAV